MMAQYATLQTNATGLTMKVELTIEQAKIWDGAAFVARSGKTDVQIAALLLATTEGASSNSTGDMCYTTTVDVTAAIAAAAAVNQPCLAVFRDSAGAVWGTQELSYYPVVDSSGNTAATIAAGCIATDAITADAVKADAVTKIGTGVWASTTRTLTSLSTLVASIAAAVWTYATRTLTSGSYVVLGPTAISNADVTSVTTLKGSTVPMSKLVYMSDGDAAQIADIASVLYHIYSVERGDPDLWDLVYGPTAVDPADCMYDTVQSDTFASSYNFRHAPHASFSHIGTIYQVEYQLTPADGGDTIFVRFEVTVI